MRPGLPGSVFPAEKLRLKTDLPLNQPPRNVGHSPSPAALSRHQSSHSSFAAFAAGPGGAACLLPPFPIADVPIELPVRFLWSAAAANWSQNARLLSSKLLLFTGLYPPAEGPSTKRVKPS